MALKINKIILIVLKLAVSSALLSVVIAKTGLSQVLSVLKNMSIPAFVTAVFLYIISQIISTFRWRLLIPEKTQINKLFSLYMIGAFFNTFLPGIIGGDAVKAYYLYQATGKGSLALASVFMDRYVGFAVLIAICAIAYPFGHQYLHGSPVAWLLPFTIISFALASFLFFGLRLGQKVGLLSEFYHYFSAYRNQSGVISKTLLLSVFVQFTCILGVYVLALGIGQNIPFLALLIYLPLITLVSTLPISISGLGVREGAFVLLLGLIGVRPETATAISLSWFVAVSAGSLIGLFEYIRYKKEKIHMSG